MKGKSMSHKMIRFLLGLAGAGAVIAAATAPAHADQYDFVGQLDAQGIYYRDITGVINDGKLVCSELRGSGTAPQVIGQLQSEGGFPGQSAAMVLYDAAQTMCPDVIPKLQAEANQAAHSSVA